MSKVDTLLKLIAYQEQHSQASDEEIAEESESRRDMSDAAKKR